MANKKREANREKSRTSGFPSGTSQREEGHVERGFRGSEGSRRPTSGSPRHLTETHGPGMSPGAGEEAILGPGPGKVGRADQSENPGRPTPSGKAPGGMKTYDQE